MRRSGQRQTRQRRVSRRANAWILSGYFGIASSAAALKAWQTIVSPHIVDWLAKTNAIVWDTITLAATLGALALGVREMVLAYFIRKEYEEDLDDMRRGYEEDLDALLRNQKEQAETVRQQAEMARQQSETVKELTDAVQQLLEQNRLLLERLDRQSNGHNPESPN
ncbi:MAG: hypothetical protein F4X64_09735 [Chloroflexi bacterium]|nr:hypothetical protein [Chloroflexota bacterium]